MTPGQNVDSRLRIPLDYERGFWSRGLVGVAGVDEAGRGPLAGPVVAAAVVLSRGGRRGGRGRLQAGFARGPGRGGAADPGAGVAVAVGAASAREIDEINILRATGRAMERAIRRLPREPDHVVVDGPRMRDLAWEHEAVVGGDALVHSIACASIVAKVCRDRLMTRLAPRYPEYGWERNMGYGTEEHRAALRRFGPTPHHRLTFGLEQLELAVRG